MAEEAKVEAGEEITPKNPEEGTVDGELAKESKVPAEVSKTEGETVPLSVFLELKKDLKELKQDLKEAKSSEKSKIAVEGAADLLKKYPDVSPEFIEDMLSVSTEKARKELESKFLPVIEEQKAKTEQEKFDKAFDSVFEKALKDNPDLPKNIDKDLIKTLVLTPKYKNVKIADILTQMYPTDTSGRASSENETVTGSGNLDVVSDFGKITDEQKKAIMADPKARKDYFNWLDTQTGR